MRSLLILLAAVVVIAVSYLVFEMVFDHEKWAVLATLLVAIVTCFITARAMRREGDL